MTNRDVGNIIVYLTALFLIFVGTLAALGWVSVKLEKGEKASAPTRKCQTIPTDVAAWGLSVQSTPSGLYFCYQQGVPFAAGMTEVVCTPMKDCKP